jgi:hypothetical protein
MYCNKCGTELTEDMDFCPECGNRANSSVPVLSRKKNHIPIILFFSTLFIIGVIIIIYIWASSSSSARKLHEQLDLGYQYLSDLDYDKAVVAFNTVIEIDPKNVEAYIGLIDSYSGLGDYESLIQVYNLACVNLDRKDSNAIADDILDVLMDRIKENLKDDKIEDAARLSEILSDIDNEASEKADQLIIDAKSDIDISEQSSEETETISEMPDVQNYTMSPEGYLLFGHYEQDGNTSNGPEPIEWIILDTNENGALLLSRYLLDCVPYNTECTNVTWETCTLRSWLNNDFLNTAFSDAEHDIIISSYVINNSNTYYNTTGGADTYDKLFCLSTDEIINYYYFNSFHSDTMCGYSQMLIAEATPYAIAMGVWDLEFTQDLYDVDYADEGYPISIIGQHGSAWWLRSPGMNNEHACAVFASGQSGPGYGTNYVQNTYLGVRPALYISL